MPRIKTERSWWQSTTPSSLLLAMKGRRIPRLRRLVAVASCRRWADAMDDDTRTALDVAERYADGDADAEQFQRARGAVQLAVWHLLFPDQTAPPQEQAEAWLRKWLAFAVSLCCARSGMEEACPVLLRLARRQGKEYEQREKVAQCQLIRDILGNPFRQPPALQRAWLASNDGAAAKLAAAISRERRFADLPILGDALEEAGCTDEQLLGHCRADALHARGCWVLDLLSGRKKRA